jgi:paraquat-inducible protein B
MFRGVKYGTVAGISLRFDPASLKIQIPVFIEMETKRVERTGPVVRDPAETIKMLIEKGLRAQLESQSFVTGQLMISLDFHPDKPARLVRHGSMIEIPTIPSSREQLTKTIENLPIDEMINSITSAAAGIDRILNAPELKESIVNLNQDLKDIQKLVRDVNAQVNPIASAVQETVRDAQKLVRNADGQVTSLGSGLQETIGETKKLVQNVNGRVDPLYEEIKGLIRQISQAAKQAEKTLVELEGSTRGDSALMLRLTESLDELAKAARAVRGLADYLERNPDALLRGKAEPGGK